MPKVSLVLNTLEREGELGMVQLIGRTGLSFDDVTEALQDLEGVGYVARRGDGLQVLYFLTPRGRERIAWIGMPKGGWIVIQAKKRMFLLGISQGKETVLTVLGYHLGEMRRNREGDIFAIKVEVVDETEQDGLLPKIREALPSELADVKITFSEPRES